MTLSLLSSITSAVPVPERRPFLYQNSSDIKKNLKQSRTELKSLKNNRLKLKNHVYKSDNKQDYIDDMKTLQATFDQAFVALYYYQYDIVENQNILFSDPEQLIYDMRKEWLTESIAIEAIHDIESVKLQKTKIKTQKNNNNIELASINRKIQLKQKNVNALKEQIKQIKKYEAAKQLQASVKPHVRPKINIPKKSKLSKSKVALKFPVNGKVLIDFGDKDELGTKSRGLVFQTDISKNVIAPQDGVVRFAGPFGKFKQLLIVEHDNGYHSLITGFDRIDTKVGEHLIAGDTIGHLSTTKAYYELRHNGVPIDPKKAIRSL